MVRARSLVAAAAVLSLFSLPALGQDDFPPPAQLNQDQSPAQGGTTKTGQTFGHSTHGEAFNEGPRQRAYLMKGIVPAKWEIATKSKEALKYFQQGIAQVHGFWYFESERSFRQAAKLDPDCAMAYWGMAMSNFGHVDNEKRAKEFISKAIERLSKASEKDKMWIKAANDLLNADPKMEKRETTRRANYLRALKGITEKFPDDIEAKAFYALELWENVNHLPEKERLTKDQIDAMMNAVLKVDPLHGVHHYRIHLWDRVNSNALNSAANCGLSQQAIAHMWHMCGHTYSAHQRYADAAYYQEASARVDHAHMMRDRVLPDQIHNFAHNNQWLVENLQFLGRAHDAITLAKNMMDLPCHPKYNSQQGWGSYSNGRTRLIETLLRFELWNEALKLDSAGYLDGGPNGVKQAERLRLIAVANAVEGNRDASQKALDELLTKKGADSFVKSAAAEIRVYLALASGDKSEAAKQLDEAKNLFKDREARLRLACGQPEKALEVAQQAVKSGKGEVLPLATATLVQYRAGSRTEASKQFDELRKLAGTADLDTPLMQEMAPIAKDFCGSADWRLPQAPAADTGKRPALDTLGPLTWSPVEAPKFRLPADNGKMVSLDDYKKRKQPVLVIQYLGSACAQCMIQLQTFAPMQKEFRDAGIEMVAITTDEMKAIKKAKAAGGLLEKIDIPQLADPRYASYKAFRSFDDFEEMPLHGAFLVDAEGKVRWQDISFEPFKDAKFVLNEAKRLLSKRVESAGSRTASVK